MKTCQICFKSSEEVDLRPYGKGGALICFPCAMSPERKKQTEANMQAQMDAAAAQSNIIVIGEPTGPRPLNPKSLV